MAEERLIDTQWVDIVPPVAPEPVSLWIWLGVILLCVSVTSIVWWYWQHQPRQRALRQLRVCEKQLHHAGSTTRPIAARIYHAVQLGVQAPPTRTLYARDAQWQEYHLRLAQCVFHAREPDADLLREVLHESRAWLRRDGLCRSSLWPRTAASGAHAPSRPECAPTLTGRIE